MQLLQAHRFRDARRWIRDWRSRTDLIGDDLFPVAIALGEWGRHQEASDAMQRGLDSGAGRHRTQLSLLLAAEELIAGRIDAARERLAAIRRNAGERDLDRDANPANVHLAAILDEALSVLGSDAVDDAARRIALTRIDLSAAHLAETPRFDIERLRRRVARDITAALPWP